MFKKVKQIGPAETESSRQACQAELGLPVHPKAAQTRLGVAGAPLKALNSAENQSKSHSMERKTLTTRLQSNLNSSSIDINLNLRRLVLVLVGSLSLDLIGEAVADQAPLHSNQQAPTSNNINNNLNLRVAWPSRRLSMILSGNQQPQQQSLIETTRRNHQAQKHTFNTKPAQMSDQLRSFHQQSNEWTHEHQMQPQQMQLSAPIDADQPAQIANNQVNMFMPSESLEGTQNSHLTSYWTQEPAHSLAELSHQQSQAGLEPLRQQVRPSEQHHFEQMDPDGLRQALEFHLRHQERQQQQDHRQIQNQAQLQQQQPQQQVQSPFALDLSSEASQGLAQYYESAGGVGTPLPVELSTSFTSGHDQSVRGGKSLPIEPLQTEASNSNLVDTGRQIDGTRVDQATSSSEMSSAKPQSESPQLDKSVEYRQRRPYLKTIFKRSELKPLMLELSKVFLRYFLDKALKDIVGMQGSGNSGSNSDSTTSRKKLDAQSELADMFKDILKNAILSI